MLFFVFVSLLKLSLSRIFSNSCYSSRLRVFGT